MKPKTGFESGTSPTEVKISSSGARILTGEHLARIRTDIQARFASIRSHIPLERSRPKSTIPETAGPQYTEKQAAVFHSRGRALSVAALHSSSVVKSTNARRDSLSYDLGSLDVPQPTAEQLIQEAMAAHEPKPNGFGKNWESKWRTT